MRRADALTAARLAGFENDRRTFTRLIVEQRVNRAAMLTAWRAGQELRERKQAAHRAADPHCTCPDCISDHAASLTKD